MISRRHLTIHQRRHFAAIHIKHFQRYVTVHWQLKTDYCRRIKRIRIILLQPEMIWQAGRFAVHMRRRIVEKAKDRLPGGLANGSGDEKPLIGGVLEPNTVFVMT